MTGLRLAAAAVAIVLFTGVAHGQNPKPITGDTVAVLETWMQAVKTHVPGQMDDPVATVAAFSYATREELNAAMPLFFRVLTQKKYDTGGNPAAGAVAAKAHAAGTSFLKQAAVLHADVAAYSERLPVRSTGSTRAAKPASEVTVGRGRPARLVQDVPPLLIEDRLSISTDGQVIGEVAASWNWPFARSLVELLKGDPFVADWYHATAAYMFTNELYGDATDHLGDAAKVLPDEPRIAFDRGCYAEALGLPLLQSLLSDRDLVTQRAVASQSGGGPGWTPPSSSASMGIPTEERTNGDAERLFRRALSLDPSLAEARVRLARLLDLRKRHDEAMRELTVVLGGNAPPAVTFYARLFAGRVASALGRAREASQHYEAALALFPDAQSALLAASQLALVESDVAASIAPVERLGPRSAEFTADPWWRYHHCSGRDADDLLRALWSTLPR